MPEYALLTLRGVTFLLEKHAEAVRMANQQQDAWMELNECTERTLREEWENMSTEPYLVNNRWTSVFMMNETSGQ
jgi:hypothetical protein